MPVQPQASFPAWPEAFHPTLRPSLQIARQAAIDTRSRCWRGPAMSDRPARIVYAPPPGKRPAPRRVPVLDKRPQAAPEPPTAPTVALTSSMAINALLGLLQAWKLPPARYWRMLTGLGYRAGSLTPDQIARVQHLLAIDAGMRVIKGDAVGEWLVAGNGSAVTSGASPVDFLTRAGTVGYAALARQVAAWARM